MAHKEGHNVLYGPWKLRVDGSGKLLIPDFWFKDKTVPSIPVYLALLLHLF